MKKITYTYWLLPLLLFTFQAGFTFFSFHQLRMEEVRASVREVFWLQNRQLFSAQYGFVGWYGVLAGLYNLFGFHLYTAKVFRLVLQLVSLYCLAAVLKKYLGAKAASIPLLTVGLSPMWLFFNTLQVSYGIDLQYLPIVLFLITQASVLVRVSGWALAMIAWLSYPTFIFYLPALVFFHLGRGYTQRGEKLQLRLGGVLMRLAAFLTPLVIVLVYIKDPIKMLYDPFYQRGIFTGGGGLILDADLFTRALGESVKNLFIRPTSYYLELTFVEFSHFLPLISFGLVLAASFLIFRKIKNLRFLVVLCWLVMILNLLVVGFTIDGGIPGGRRNTPLLAAFYGLFTIAWYAVITKKIRFFIPRTAFLTLLLLILIHHLIVYPFNLIKAKEPSLFAYNSWLAAAVTPAKSLQEYLDTVGKTDLYLNCETMGTGSECEYGTVFAAVKGACLWDHLSCHDIYGYIGEKGGYRQLNLQLWDNYEFEK